MLNLDDTLTIPPSNSSRPSSAEAVLMSIDLHQSARIHMNAFTLLGPDTSPSRVPHRHAPISTTALPGPRLPHLDLFLPLRLPLLDAQFLEEHIARIVHGTLSARRGSLLFRKVDIWRGEGRRSLEAGRAALMVRINEALVADGVSRKNRFILVRMSSQVKYRGTESVSSPER